MSKLTGKRTIEETAQALAELHVLHSIIAIAENSSFRSTHAQSAGRKIIAACRDASAICLMRYDKGRAALKAEGEA